jgi:beta-barrel assembly-enhancing protease
MLLFIDGWAQMRFGFVLAASHERIFLRTLLALAVLVPAVWACAQAPTSDVDDEFPASPSKNILSREDAKKIAKYDVTRIGNRGIGHGLNMYSLSRERQLGESLAATFDSSSRMVTDPVLNDYVNRVTQTLVRNSDAEVPFTVRLIDSSDIPRAYGLPGGFIYIDSALIFAADSESELAGVIAREIAHVAARHATRALTRKNLFSMAGPLAMLTGPFGMILQETGSVAGPLSVKKFDREAEYEADLLGIEYAYSAGYDPEALLAALEKLRAMEIERSGAFAKVPGYHLAMKVPFHDKIAHAFSSFPLTQDRIRRLQSEITIFLPDRKEYIVDTDEFQEIRERLFSLRAPLHLRHHGEDGGNPNAPVLRRTQQDDPEPTPGKLRTAFTLVH